MYLTISKRFEFSASARQFRPDWSEQVNEDMYGPFWQGRHGHGYNYVATFVFHGPVDRATGMMINVTTIKQRVNQILDDHYDHRFLNVDTPVFSERVPTAENVAMKLLEEVTPLFKDEAAQPVACHLRETDRTAAIAYSDGTVEREVWIEFSAARRTCSPHLSDEENLRLFGIASRTSGHGHGYRLKTILNGDFDAERGVLVPHRDWSGALAEIHRELDHRNLNTDVDGLKKLPITTESLSRYVYKKLATSLPVGRVRLYEMPQFFAECRRQTQICLGMSGSFHAAHRLHSPSLSDEENRTVYDKCNNPAGHGHQYRIEATMCAKYDERSGTVYDFTEFGNAIDASLEPWRYRHLDEDTDDFADVPSTGENIVARLWLRLDDHLDNGLVRLRLWETPNNRFTRRRAWRPQ